ncbi:MAG: PrsW family glutamic-type intramembrane protease [Gemmiger sp.]|nr:PrsW family glutamic-type intramembrane protease [Gemmiger sp.]
MKLFLACILSNLPGFILLVLLIRQSRKEKTPVRPLSLLVIFGFLAMVPIVALQTVVGYANEIPFIGSHALLSEILMTVIRLAFIEELCKLAVTAILTWKGNYFVTPLQGMMYPAIVGLSFGILESIAYMALSIQQFPTEFWSIVLMRALLGAPAHGAYGLIIGIYYGRAKQAARQHNTVSKRKNLMLALFIPTGIHGLYDWLVSSQIIKIGDTSIVTVLVILMDIFVIFYAYYAFYKQWKQKATAME